MYYQYKFGKITS